MLFFSLRICPSVQSIRTRIHSCPLNFPLFLTIECLALLSPTYLHNFTHLHIASLADARRDNFITLFLVVDDPPSRLVCFFWATSTVVQFSIFWCSTIGQIACPKAGSLLFRPTPCSSSLPIRNVHPIITNPTSTTTKFASGGIDKIFTLSVFEPSSCLSHPPWGRSLRIYLIGQNSPPSISSSAAAVPILGKPFGT